MEQNERNPMNEQQNNMHRQGSDSMNTAAGLRNELSNDQNETGSGRSYDYGVPGSSDEATNEQLGRNSNQQNVSNPVNAPGTGNTRPSASEGSGMSPKTNITGSDTDGQTA